LAGGEFQSFDFSVRVSQIFLAAGYGSRRFGRREQVRASGFSAEIFVGWFL
jgi:hypothetical protein